MSAGAIGALFSLLTLFSPEATAAPPPDGWRIHLSAATSGLVDKARLTLGASTTSSEGFDAFDDPHPPALPGAFLDLVTVHEQAQPGWETQPLPTARYRAQFGAPLGGASRTIPFVAETDQAGPVTIQWSLVPDLELSQHFAELHDVEDGTSVDMWAEAAYSFAPVGATHRFEIRLTPGRSEPTPPAAGFTYAVQPGLVVVFTDTSIDVDGTVVAWAWAFGDGGSSAEQDPTHTYATKGTKTVTLTVTDDSGGSASVSGEIHVASPPEASFTYDPAGPVSGAEVRFTDASSDVDGTVVGWVWSFGDGGIVSERSPRHVYAAAGSYEVTLVATDDDGTTDTASTTLVVGPADPATAPVALFRPDVPTRDVAATANGGVVVASSGYCCSGHDPAQMLDDVVGYPWATSGVTGHYATIQVSAGAPVLVETIQVQPRSDGSFDQRVKDFAVDVSTTGFAAGDFTPALSATAANEGALQSFALPPGTLAKYVRYRPLSSQGSPSYISTSKFKVLASASGPRTVPFLNQSTNAVSYEWDFGDGVTSTQPNPTHTYAQTGLFTVTLVARSVDGRLSTHARNYQARGPVASFDVAPGAPMPGEPATFTSTSTFPTAAGVKWTWTFGDGGTAGSAARVLHTYAGAGTYTATLTVIDTEGIASTVSREVTVADDPSAPPRTLFNPRSKGKSVAAAEAGASVHSSSGEYNANYPAATAIDADPGNSYWATPQGTPTNGWIKIRLAGTRPWRIDRVRLAGPSNSERVKDFKILVSLSGTEDADFAEVLSAQNPNTNALTEHRLAAPVAARHVMIRALNNWGSSSRIGIQQIRVLTGPDTPAGRNLALAETGATIPGFSGQYSTSYPAATLIDAPASGYWASPNGATSSWIRIDLAGGEARQLDVVRLQPGGGTERVRDFQVLVSATGTADADFTLAHEGTAVNADLPFDVPLDTPLSAKYVLLRFLNNRGSTCCVAASQFKAFTGQEDGLSVFFENLTRGALSYAWDFGDGQTSTEFEPTHTFPGPGTYAVTLAATNANGATSYVLPQVVRAAAIQHSPATPEAQEQVDFEDASPPELGLAAWAWDFGDGTTSPFRDPVKTYAAAGTYAVTLTGTDYEGNVLVANATVPVSAPTFRAMFHPRGGLNVASLENGASVVASSGQSGAAYGPGNLLDARADTTWTSPPVGSQWVEFSLAGGETYQVDRFLLLGRQDCCSDQHPRDFEIAVSQTGTADADFRTVLLATLPAGQTTPVAFVLPRPVSARYVLYRALNSRGSANVSTAVLQVASGQVNSSTVTFDDRSVGGAGPLTHAWTFGDGGTSSDPSPTHTFPGPGVYPVTLTVTDANGAIATHTLPVRVLQSLAPSFTNTPPLPDEAQAATFADTTAAVPEAAIAMRRWSWGDGSADTAVLGSTTTHTFPDSGAFPVTLQVTDTWARTTSATRSVAVANVAPSVNAGPDWRWRQERALEATPTISDAAGTRDPVTCTWSYGDGSPDGAGCPFSHAYAATGTYTATVTAADDDGGTATDSFDVEVIGKEAPPGGGGSGSGGGTGKGLAAKDHTYTLDADFELGTLLNVNHEAPGTDQLQLNAETRPFPFVYVANSGRGTAVRIDVNTGTILGEYRTAPDNRAKNPSRTTVDKLGNVWVTNRNENETRTIDGLTTAWGSATRIGLVVGGTRTDAAGTPNPSGEYLKPPFEYNTCVDRNGDGLVRTSRGLGNHLGWPNTSGVDHDGGVETALDECIQLYVRVRGVNTRTVAIDANNDAWIGGSNNFHEKVDGETGQRVPDTAFDLGCGGYGGLIDGNGVLWSARYGQGLLRYDTRTRTGVCLGNAHGDYGLGVDPVAGHIWHTNVGGGRVVKLNPAATTAATIEIGRYPHGNNDAQGVAVDSKGSVWVAHALYNAPTIGRVRTDGLFLGTSFLGPSAAGPTGVAVDANGKVWAANYNTDNASRIDPEIGQKIAGTVPSGWYDLVVGLGSGANPYNYSDMTGAVAIGATSPSGFWSIQQDATAPGTIWKRIAWNGTTPQGTSITVEARAADSQSELPSRPFAVVSSGAPLAGVVGRFVEVRATLQTTERAATPVLADIRISANMPPSAADAAAETKRDTPVAVTLQASDPEGDPLTYAVVDDPAHGTVSLAGDLATYAPADGYVGPDSFTYKAKDADGESNLATVTITVVPGNTPPTAADQSVATPEDTPVAITLAGSDVDGDNLTYTIVTPPLHGVLSGSGASPTYTPAAEYNGPDAFTFKANDGTADSNVATVSITVTPVNDAPTAADQSVTTPEDTPVAITLAGSDIDGDSLTHTVVTPPQHGTLSGSGASLTYTPAAEYSGPDAFTFRANDGTADSNVATVSITVTPVNDLPVAADQSVTTPEDTPVGITLAGSDVDGDALTYTIVTPPQHGTLSGSGASLTYTPAANYNGPDAFTFQANDGTADSNVATVTITVTPRPNLPPSCEAAAAAILWAWPPNHEMKPVSIADVTDPDGDPVAVRATSVFQDEPVDAKGDGNTSPDATLAPLAVRWERAGKGDGRVYHIGFEADDGRGGSCQSVVKLCVPHDRGNGCVEGQECRPGHSQCVDQGPLYDSTLR
jgi:PKD repeat protein